MLYKHMKTNEVVYEEDAEAYAIDQLGITITPKGKGGAFTQEQTEFICEFTDWYFSGNWIKEEEKEENETDYEAEIIDIHYQEKLERKWGIL